MEHNKALTAVVNGLQIEETVSERSSAEQLEVLVTFIDDLIRNDFNGLLSILYRVDISEEKLKRTLAENKDTQVQSAELIAELLVEREQEKIISRAKYRRL